MDEPKLNGKPFAISKWVVLEAYGKVKANQGAAGVDGQSIAEFERDLKGNLYRLWNRMSSGTYFPPPVRAVEIPKKAGGVRTLGVPTVADRVAQTVVRMVLEPEVEPLFHPDSYGYRPRRSAHDALAACRQRCWEKDWVIDLDIRAFFDSIDHDLLMKAVSKHTDLRWVLLYVQRWLEAPLQGGDGTLSPRDRGTPQARRSHLCWRICFFTTRSIGGWPGSSPTALSSVTRMMQWSTAEVKPRPTRCSRLSPPGWRRSVWSCIQARRASCTARTTTAAALTSTSGSTFWATRFVADS